MCCEPHPNGVLKCPEGMREVQVEHVARPNENARHDMRGAMIIPNKKMHLINEFVSTLIDREVNMQVDIYQEVGLQIQDAIHAVMIRYSFEESEYSFDRAYKMNQRARRGYTGA